MPLQTAIQISDTAELGARTPYGVIMRYKKLAAELADSGSSHDADTRSTKKRKVIVISDSEDE
jgi:hypothetical protein